MSKDRVNIDDMTAVEFDLYVAGKLHKKRKQAMQRGIEFGLTFQAMKNLMKAKRCYYTGVPLIDGVNSEGNPRPNTRTIDRIDSSKGYVKGNVVACAHSANNVKAMFEAAGIEGLKAGEAIFKKSIKRIKKMEK